MMRILAIETSDQSGSVAALEADRTVDCRDLDSAVRSAVSLAPAIADLLKDVRWQPRDVQLVAVATGPGSFTGLRVGVTTAKMFAYATRAEVLGVNTLEAIAWQAPAEHRPVVDGDGRSARPIIRRTLSQAIRPACGNGREKPHCGTTTPGWRNWPQPTEPVAVSGPGLLKLSEPHSEGRDHRRIALCGYPKQTRLANSPGDTIKPAAVKNSAALVPRLFPPQRRRRKARERAVLAPGSAQGLHCSVREKKAADRCTRSAAKRFGTCAGVLQQYLVNYTN